MPDLAYAAALFRASDFPAAERALKSILDGDPTIPQARVMLGIVYAKTARPAKAAEFFEAVLRENSKQYDSLVWLATVKTALGEVDEAISLAQTAISDYPEAPQAYNALGLAYLSRRNTEPAVDAFRQLIRLQPRSAQAQHNLGLALRLSDRTMEALAAFKKAVELDPKTEANYLQVHRQHLLISAWYDAIRNLEEGLKQAPASIPIADALATCYCHANRKEEGEQLFRSVLVRRPGYCHGYSLWLQEEGRFEDSVRLLRKWIDLEPLQGVAYFCLSEARAFELEDGWSLLEHASEIAETQDLGPLEQMYLCYALARSLEREKRYEEAIGQFDRANQLAFQIYNEGRRMDPDSIRVNNECLKELFSETSLESLKTHGSQDETPIFIVGMIRSGTTLTDQIVSSHPQVRSAGELPFWKLEGPRISFKWYTGGVDADDIGWLAQNYLNILNTMAGPSPRITDKQPLNYELLGLIHAVFPKAKIIHIRRSPLDTSLSIYSTHFGGGPAFAYRQDNIVAYYREYMNLMEYWRKVLPPESLLEIDYEALVEDREPVIANILQFCGLPWDDACLHHDENQATVSTPSKWQARQPVYKSSVEKWKQYEPWLGRLLDLRTLEHPPARPFSPITQ